VGDYAFTTLRPVPALTRIKGVLVQLVEIPGLIEGAHEDRGGGRALLGVLRSADAILYCQDVRAPHDVLDVVRNEVLAAGIELPAMLAATKMDEASAQDLYNLQATVADLPVVGVTILDDTSLDQLKEAIWQLTGLLRVYLRHDRHVEEEPLALEPGATIMDVIQQIHKDLRTSFRFARVWGPSAHFEGQRVGRNHRLVDGDTVEIIA
jgi:ribosome-interacting GTPase 1